MNKRLFVGDLPNLIDQKDLFKKFSKFGHVGDIEIKEKPSGRFAFINFSTNDDNINYFLDKLSKSPIKGNFLKVQLAKENFLSKLERERRENNTGIQKKIVKNNTTENTLIPNFKGTLYFENDENIEKQEKKNIEKPHYDTKNKLEYIEEDKCLEKARLESENKNFEKSENTKFNNQETKKSNIEIISPKKTVSKKFKKDDTFKKKCINYESEESIENLEAKLEYKKINHKVEIKKSVNEINTNTSDLIKNHYNYSHKQNDFDHQNISDLKRQQAVQEKKKAYQDQKNILKKALANIDTVNNSKIVFDSDLEEESTEQSSKKTFLLDDEDIDENDDISRFKIKPQFQGEKGQRLLELQSRYNNDPRFVLDERFQTVGDENVKDSENVVDEKERQMNILQEVLGYPLEVKSERTKHNKPMKHFDPSQKDHLENFILKNEIPEEEINKNKKKNKNIKKIKLKEEIEKISVPVSKERFYQIDNLKDSLNKKEEGFSLLKMFGNEENIEIKEKSIDESYEQLPKKKLTKLPELMSNPFKYDSTDDENESELKNENITKTVIKPVNEPTIAQGIARDLFFLSQNDSRFSEAWNFLMNSHEREEGDFNQWRRTISCSIKLKRKNAEQRENKQNKKKKVYNTKKLSKNKPRVFKNNKHKKHR